MSQDIYRAPEETPLANRPISGGQLYPPMQESGHQRHPSTGSYNPPPAAASVVMSQPIGAVPGSAARYRYEPLLIVCHKCGATVTTTVTDVRGWLNYVTCGLMCCMGCWLGCCLIPLFINDFKDVEHSCPNCQQNVGTFVHMGK